MGKRGSLPRPRTGNAARPDDKPATLKDRLSADTLEKLKRKAEALKLEEAARAEEKRLAAEAAREAERKRKEQDFGYLLEQSDMDWTKFK
ncbi:YqkE family protein [Paenibacillaceae bacterium WGS1546]|uniref:YqkE family protein n=1 Tax=Cohnella sp. WGS1546 TaxID=3366810 RepID=UPI00372D0ABA